MTPPSQTTDENEKPADAITASVPPPEPVLEVEPVLRPAMRRRPGPRRLTATVRGLLVLIALGWATVFGIAVWLNPYQGDDGTATVRKMGTHHQLGLLPCGFLVMTGKPCPSCGMTTSFSLMMHGDPLNAARANWVGVVLVVFGALMIPWAIVSSIRGRYLWIRSLEWLLLWCVSIFLVLSLSRWAVVLLLPANP